MKPTPVDRYMFTVEEVIAAILPNVGRARELELRVDADGYVVVDIVQPTSIALHNAGIPDDLLDDDAERHQPVAPESRADAPTSPGDVPGPREEEARSLCRQQLFRVFLEVKTEEAALRVMAERCHVQQLADLDRSRSNGMNLRHVIEDFEGWKIT